MSHDSFTYSCELCDEEDTAEMVACDKCELWFHFGCVGVTSEVEKVSWLCVKCKESSSKINSGDDPSKFGGNASQKNPNGSINKASATKTQGDQGNPSSQVQNDKTKKPSARAKSKSSHSSNRRRVKLQLGKLEEQKRIEEKFIEMKYQILEQEISSSENDDEDPVIQVNTKVSEWLNKKDSSRRIPPIPSQPPPQPNTSKGDAVQYQLNPEDVRRNASRQLHQIYPSALDRQDAGVNRCDPNQAPDNLLLLNNINLTRQHIAARQAMPKELPCFSGRPEEWPLFISAFEGSTRTCGFSPDENLIRLQKALKGKALDAVRSRLMLPTCVPAVIETLRQLFGKLEFIIHTLLSQIRNAPSIKADRLDSIVDLSLSVQNLCAVIDATNMQAYRVNPCLLEELVQKLPAQMKLNWSMHKMCINNPDVTSFNNWLAQMARAASDVSYMSSPTQPIQNNTSKAESAAKKRGF